MNPLLIFHYDLTELSEGACILKAFLYEKISSDRMMIDYPFGRIEPENMELARQLEKGWFPCSVEDVLEAIGMSASRQSRYLRELIAKKRIKMERRGLPSRRWIAFVKEVR